MDDRFNSPSPDTKIMLNEAFSDPLLFVADDAKGSLPASAALLKEQQNYHTADTYTKLHQGGDIR